MFGSVFVPSYDSMFPLILHMENSVESDSSASFNKSLHEPEDDDLCCFTCQVCCFPASEVVCTCIVIPIFCHISYWLSLLYYLGVRICS